MSAWSGGGTAAVILAAGRGARAGAGKVPKQYQLIGGRTVLARTLERFLEHPKINTVKVVIGADDSARYAAIAPSHPKLLPPIGGGDTRRHSALHGLASLAAQPPERVLIHDAARPFAGADVISRVIEALDTAEAVIPALPVNSTLKRIDASGAVSGTVARDDLVAAETPQGFRFAAILAAHRKAAEAGMEFTDDAAVAEWAGMTVRAVPGDPANIKLTTAADMAAADRRLAGEAALALGDIRVGTGYDVHAFGPGDAVMLGGLAIPHGRGLVGHSDADVALHALTDAILGALADGDIGVHFPPSDAQWRGAPSERFLADAVRRVGERGGRIAHLDLAIIAEAPKIGPHRDAMRQRIATICGVTIDRVGVQATTNERLGFIGRGEGIAAHATATIRLPFGMNP